MTKRTRNDGPDVAMLYDDAHLTKQITDPAGLAIATSYLYDELGRATRVTNPDSTYTVAIFDGLGQLTKTIQYDSSNNRLAVTGRIYDDALGLVTKTYQVAAPASRDTFNSTDDPYTESLYTAAGRLTKTLDPNANATTYDYDSLGRQITITDAANNKQIVIYDDADRTLTQLRLDYDGAAHIIFATAMEYDGLNRVTRIINQGPDGAIGNADDLSSIVWFDALGQVTQTQDSAGKQVATAYDDLGRLTRTTEDSGGGGIARHTDRLYDRASRLTRLIGYTDGTSGDQATDHAYNKAGVLTRTTYPDDAGGDRGYVEHFFDAAGRLTKLTDQEAQDTVIVYDSMSRRTSITRGTEVDTFTYMPWGAVSLARRGTSGNPDAVSQSERLYDGLHRLTHEAQSAKETTARNVDYAYDDAGNVLTLTYPNGAVIATSYTAVNQRDVIKRSGSQLADYEYVGGRPKSLIYETGGNDITFAPTYDGVGRATRLATARDGTDIATFGYAFDNANNITTKTLVHRSNDTEDYAMDTLYRLTHVAYNQRASDPYQGFIYDDLGNRLTLDDNGTDVAGLYNSANELTKLDANNVLYDKKGNLTKDASGNSYFYDRGNKLTRIEDSGSTRIASYAYDPFNRRIEKDVEDAGGDIVTRFYWNDRWQLLEETDDAGTPAVQRYYVWGNYIDELLLMRDVIGTGGSANADYFAARDHLYGVAALIDTSGSVVERYEYDAYGAPHIMDGSYGSLGSSAYGNNILFDGYYHDAESGLYYVRNRTYDPTTMRWLQRDPVGYVDGMSLYVGYFAMLGGLDSLGLDAVSVALKDYNLLTQALQILSRAHGQDSCWEARLKVVIKATERKLELTPNPILEIADQFAGAARNTSEFAEYATYVAKAIKRGSDAGESIAEIIRDMQSTEAGRKAWDMVEEVFDDINDIMKKNDVAGFLGRVSDAANAAGAIASIAASMDPAKAGDPGRWLKLAGDLGQSVGQWAPIPGVGEMIEFYGQAASGIAGMLDGIAKKAGQKNLQYWKVEGYSNYRGAWFGDRWARKIVDPDDADLKWMDCICDVYGNQ